MSGSLSSPAAETYVITGGTRGIGFGIARELLQRGQNVFLCGRSQESVESAITKLEDLVVKDANKGGHVGGVTCNIADQSDVQKLWDAAIKKFSRVDVWVNNAAISPHVPLLPADDDNDDDNDNMKHISDCIDINIKGAIHCCRVASKGMRKQELGVSNRNHRIYLMEGLGSDGSVRTSETMVYGLTKYAGTYLANAMEKEFLNNNNNNNHSSNISLGLLSPGMVTTELLLGSFMNRSPEEVEKTKKIMNILADREETVTPWLADQLVSGNLTIRWLTPAGAVGRFVKALFVSRDLFQEDKTKNDKEDKTSTDEEDKDTSEGG